MTLTLSQNTQAILLLTAPLIVGRGKWSSDLLSPGEYKQLVRHLVSLEQKPADLLSSDAQKVRQACKTIVDEDRMGRLLERGFLLTQAIERWQARAIWVVSRADPEYPRLLKTRLREDAPAIIYGCGDIGLLDSGGLAVVGSRHVDEALVDETIAVGRLAAKAGRAVISGGAKGIDQAAMRGGLEAGGRVVGVLANNLEQAVMQRDHRDPLLEGQLVLISPYDPNAGFNVGNAMQRNKSIYALADAALVVSSDLNKGGTWAGAKEQLDKLRFVPVYVRSAGAMSPGLKALQDKGALPWPNPADADAFEQVLSTGDAPEAPEMRTLAIVQAQDDPDVSAGLVTGSPVEASDKVAEQNPHETREPKDMLFDSVCTLVERLLTAPKQDREIADALDITPAQTKVWLNRMVSEGTIKKLSRPVRYVADKDLFDKQRHG